MIHNRIFEIIMVFLVSGSIDKPTSSLNHIVFRILALCHFFMIDLLFCI